MNKLKYIPASEFDRIRCISQDPLVTTDLFAKLARINALYMIACAGSGHIGSSFSSLDIVSWLFLNELRFKPKKKDLYFSSKGHDAPGLYAVLTGLGRLPFPLIHRLRRVDGLPGHPDVHTKGIETNTGSLGMGVSKAKGMISAARIAGKSIRAYVLTGDGELQEGQFWESLVSAANGSFDEITVIVDHNKVQSDTLVSKVSNLGDLESKFLAYGWHVDRCDGHDLTALSQIISKQKKITSKPKVIIADTIKGCGVSFMEHTTMAPQQRLYAYHSGAPDEETYTRAVDELINSINKCLKNLSATQIKTDSNTSLRPIIPNDPQRLIPAYGSALVREAELNNSIVALDADLALDCGLLPFEDRFPNRFFECGIAEQDMVSQAGGMALKGLRPVVHSFACFLSTRPNEQIYNNASENTQIVYVGSLAGLLPGGPGHSHQAVRDIASLSGTPSLEMLQPSCEQEVSLCVEYCLRHSTGSTYLRLVSIPCCVPYQLPKDYIQMRNGQGVALREGKDAVFIGYGPVMLTEAWNAASKLAKNNNIHLKVLNLPWLNRIDRKWLCEAVSGYPWVFTIDDHYLEGGQGQLIAAELMRLRLPSPPRIHGFGVQGIPACGRNDEVLQAHGLDVESLVKVIVRLMGQS